MLFIGICGASGSGKSTLSEELVRAVGAVCTVINRMPITLIIRT